MANKTKDGSPEAATAKALDSILETLQSLLIVQGHGAGLTKAQVRALAKVGAGRVTKVWSQLQAAKD